MRSSIRQVLSAVWVLAAHGCSSSGNPAADLASLKTDANKIAPAEKVVDTTGGTIATSDGSAALTIPAGAVESDTKITISPLVPAPAGSIGQAFEIGPTGTMFKKPITITLSYKGANLGGDSPSALKVATQQGADWVGLEATVLDPNSQTVSGQTTHLSPYALRVFKQVVNDSGTERDRGIVDQSVPKLDVGPCGGENQPCCATKKCNNSELICAGDDGNTCVTCGQFGPTSTKDSHGLQYCCPGNVCAPSEWGLPTNKVFCNTMPGCTVCAGNPSPSCQDIPECRPCAAGGLGFGNACCPTSGSTLLPAAEECGVLNGDCIDASMVCASQTIPGYYKKGYCMLCGGLLAPCCSDGSCGTGMTCQNGLCK